jgi:L-alanine-DL-glutamate epimerase-like enolase superfamily enzyme
MRVSTITAIDTLRVSLEVAPDLVVHGAAGTHDHSDFLLVRVTSSSGLCGFGEVSATPLWSGEDAVTAEHFIRSMLAPQLIGAPLSSVGVLEDRLDRVLAGNNFTKAGVSIALWDLAARELDVPLAQALGGPYRTEVPIKCSLSGSPDQMRRAHAYAVAQGFVSFKVKVGLDLEGDLRRVALARELAGPDALLGVDANTGWSVRDARAAIPRLAALGVTFVEQPVAARDLPAMRALRDLGLPIIADESVGDLADLTALVRADAADIVSLYVGMSGGPGRAVRLGSIAAAFGLSSVVGSNGEMGIGAAAQLHVACALPELSSAVPSDVIGSHFYSEEILEVGLNSTGAVVTLPDGPGLGVVPRADLVEQMERGVSV